MPRKKIPENYENMRKSIIDASIQLMIQKNVSKFSLTDVADRLGITKAAIYWYFSSKEMLIEGVASAVYDTYIGRVTEIAQSTMTSYEKLKLLLLGSSDTIEGAMMSLFPVKFYLDAYSESNGIKKLIQDGYRIYNDLVTGLITEGIRNGEFETSLPAIELAKYITGSIDGLAFQNLLVSSEKIEVPRNIILAVISEVLRPAKNRRE